MNAYPMRRIAPFFSVCLLAFSLCSAAAAGQPAARDLAVWSGWGDIPGSGMLSVPVKDAQAIGAALESTGLYRKVVVLTDEAEDGRFKPTDKNITDTLTLFSRTVGSGANIVFYFSGRGSMKNGVAHIQLQDADFDLSVIASIMRASKGCGGILLLDTAWPGSTGGGLTGAVSLDGVAVVTSCQPGQQSRSDPELGRGLFSLALENTLHGVSSATMSVGELVDRMDLFMSDYCLGHLVTDGKSIALSKVGRDIVFLPQHTPVVASPSPGKMRESRRSIKITPSAITPKGCFYLTGSVHAL